MLKSLITAFIKQNGRNPNAVELLKLKFKAASQSGKGKVFDLTGKQIDTSRPIIGGKNVAETEAQVKARMVKENRRNVQKSYLRQLDEKILDVEEGFLTKADLDNMSPDALDSLRRNVDPHGMHKHFGSEEIGKIDDYASGGIARVGMVGGGTAWKKFIEMLFIKSSNDIRQGKGLFKGLTEKQRIVQHDNLTKKIMEWQKTGKTVGLEKYFGVDPHTAFIDARTKVKRQGIIKDVPEVKTKKVDKNRKLTDEEWRDYVEENIYELGPYKEELTGNETIAQLDDMIAESRAYEADMYRQYKRGDLDKYVKPEVLEEQRLFRQKK